MALLLSPAFLFSIIVILINLIITMLFCRECDEKSFTATLADGGKILKLGSEQGEFMFHAVWLRKYCKCPKCFFSSNGHTGNLIFPHQLDPATTIVSVEISGKLSTFPVRGKLAKSRFWGGGGGQSTNPRCALSRVVWGHAPPENFEF